jgi:hypothetical protein
LHGNNEQGTTMLVSPVFPGLGLATFHPDLTLGFVSVTIQQIADYYNGYKHLLDYILRLLMPSS